MTKSKEKWKVYKNVFSEFSLRTLFKLSSEGHFEELLSPIASGKEANIFSAKTKEDGKIIVKIYRLENCNFNKMHSYLKTDPRYLNFRKQRRAIVFAWTQREYKNLMIAREAIRVPTPLAYKNNILLMEFIGREEPAPMLKDSYPKNPEDFLKKTILNIKKLLEVNLIHADLSEFNILNLEEEPVFIDFSQSTLKKADNAKELFKRDLKNIKKFFEKTLKKEKVSKIISKAVYQ